MDQCRRETIAELARAGQSTKEIINVTRYPKLRCTELSRPLELEGVSLDVLTNLAAIESGHKHS